MLINKLIAFHDRHVNIPVGWHLKPVTVLVLGKSGKLLRIEDPVSMLAPVQPTRSSNTAPAMIVDTADYALGLNGKRHTAYCELLDTLSEHPSVVLLRKTLAKGLKFDAATVKGLKGRWISFRVNGDDVPVHLLPEVKDAIDSHINSGSPIRCMITGKPGYWAELHPNVRYLGASLISANADSMCSWGQSSKDTCIMSKESVSKYSNALDALLRDKTRSMTFGKPDDKQKQHYVFFGENTEALEASFSEFVSKGVFAGLGDTDPNAAFTVAAIGKRQGRAYVSFNWTGTAEQLVTNIERHIADTFQEGADKAPTPFTVTRELAPHRKLDMQKRELKCEYLNSIVANRPYPYVLRELLSHRIAGAESTDSGTIPRFSITRTRIGALVGFMRRNSNKEADMALNLKRRDKGYILGMFLALADRIQAEAIEDVKSRLADRFYGSIVNSPVQGFATILELNWHHLRRMTRKEREGTRIYYERLMHHVIEQLGDVPKFLNAEQKCLVALGFNHMRADFFKKKGMRATDALFPKPVKGDEPAEEKEAC